MAEQFSLMAAQIRLGPVLSATGLWHMARSNEAKTGIKLRPYNNTWQRKRESGYLIEVLYKIDGKTIMRHVEPWVNYPSDQLIAKMMLLPIPLEVTK